MRPGSRPTEVHLIQVFVYYKVSSWINFIADPRGDKKMKITFTGLNKQITTDRYISEPSQSAAHESQYWMGPDLR